MLEQSGAEHIAYIGRPLLNPYAIPSNCAGTEKSHGFLMDPTSLPVGKKQGGLAPVSVCRGVCKVDAPTRRQRMHAHIHTYTYIHI